VEDPDASTLGPGTSPMTVATGRARAYCGPAHGRQWTVDADEPPACVELSVGPTSCLYRLVRQRRNRRPAHDEMGNLLYVHVADRSPNPPEPVLAGRILSVPGT